MTVSIVLIALIGAALGAALSSLSDLDTPRPLSVTPLVGVDGENANKGKINELIYETSPGSGVFVNVLISVYGDSPDPSKTVWAYDGSEWAARDNFVTRSLDGGATWSTPINISNMAGLSSATADHDGDPTTAELTYWGDCEKPQVAATPQTGKNIAVSWVGAYCDSGLQGSVRYIENHDIEVPFKCQYIARSSDAGATWTVQRMSDGSRDAKQDAIQATGTGFASVWQEDPQGLQPGEAEGPGDGGSGAKVSKGTDAWYTAVAKAGFNAGFPPGVRVTDNFDRFKNGIEEGACGASRPQVMLVGQTALIAYEESKGVKLPGVPKVEDGKYIRFHAITPFSNVTTSQTRVITDGGTATVNYGLTGDPSLGEGWLISNPLESGRRVRIVVQGQPGPTTGIFAAFLWRQGLYDQGGPSDVMVRTLRKDLTDPTSTGLRPDDMHPAVNFSVNDTLPYADHGRTEAMSNAAPVNLSSSLGITAGSDDNSMEDARAHRGFIDGDFVVLGYSWTSNQPLARYTDMANYNFFVRRSFDGGVTWDEPRNLSGFKDTRVNAREPRLVKVPTSPNPADVRNPAAFVAAWGSELNQYDYLQTGVIDLDIYITRSSDQGATYEPVKVLAIGSAAQSECQLRPTSDCLTVNAVWMEDNNAGKVNVMYRTLTGAFEPGVVYPGGDPGDIGGDDGGIPVDDGRTCGMVPGGRSGIAWLLLLLVPLMVMRRLCSRG
ncbi:MAG: choice-of-anchor O protein [Planctomycetota bacterium]